MTDSASKNDPLAELREKLQQARKAAEQFAGSKVETNGSKVHSENEPNSTQNTTFANGHFNEDVQSIMRALDILRSIVPPELQQQLAELVREVLQVIRALIDWYLQRLDGSTGDTASTTVEDIPIK